MRTLVLLILSIVLCFGESCWYSEKMEARDSVDVRSDSLGEFYNFEKNRFTRDRFVAYFCIEGKLFVGIDGSITQVFRNSKAMMENVLVERCKCREEKNEKSKKGL